MLDMSPVGPGPMTRSDKEGEFADVLYFQSGLRAVLYAFRYLPGPTDKGSWSNLGIRNPKDSGRWLAETKWLI